MLQDDKIIILNILNKIKNKNFYTIEELKDSYKNEYDKIISTMQMDISANYSSYY